MPLPSTNVQTTTVVPKVVIGNVVVVVPLIVAEQLSVVVGIPGVTEQAPVTLARVGVAGGVVSTTVTV